MGKATATYVAPERDSKVVEMSGVTFFDGHDVELNSDQHAHLMGKLATNPHFKFVAIEDDERPRRSRPPGRAPKGMVWSDMGQEFVEIGSNGEAHQD